MKKILLIFFLLSGKQVLSQRLWHDKERTVHYRPEGNDFVCENGKLRFNRALYGTLNNRKQLKNLIVKAVANDVVIGLMALTLTR